MLVVEFEVGGCDSVVNWGFVPILPVKEGVKVLTIRPEGDSGEVGEGVSDDMVVDMDESSFLLATAWAAAWGRKVLPTR